MEKVTYKLKYDGREYSYDELINMLVSLKVKRWRRIFLHKSSFSTGFLEGLLYGLNIADRKENKYGFRKVIKKQ